MNLYFNFFNDNENKYIIMNKINNNIKINLNSFNLKVYLSDINLDYSEVTDFQLVIERVNNGVYLVENRISGVINQDVLEFNKVKLDESLDGNTTYKLYFQFFIGGILYHNDIENYYSVNIKSKCENFNIDIFDSIKIGDIYELQSFDGDSFEMKFKISLNNHTYINSLMYHYVISPNEKLEIETIDYKKVNSDDNTFSTIIIPSHFKDNISYLHFYLKDSFENTIHEYFKITTKNNTLSLFEIVNTEIYSDVKNEFGIFYNVRNVDSITPVIEYMDSNNLKKTIKSEKSIGTYDKRSNNLVMKLSDFFDTDLKNDDIKLYFILNNDEKLLSNAIMVYSDQTDPIITLMNLDDNYSLITDDSEFYTLNGKLEDNNFFYLGDDYKKINAVNGKHFLILYSNEKLSDVIFNNDGNKIPLLKYGNYFITETLGNEFEVFSIEGNKIDDVLYINDYSSESYKLLYFMFDKTQFSQYERNIINANKSLIIKGEEISSVIQKQEFFDFNNMYYIKAYIDRNISANPFKFDIGVQDIEYSFLTKVNNNTVSCDIDNTKKLFLNYNDSSLIAIKSSDKSELYKCNDKKIVDTKQSITYEEVSLCSFSLNQDEYISVISNLNFFDDNFNSVDSVPIYGVPEIKVNNEKCIFKNYSIKQIDSNMYSFSVDIPLGKGVNKYQILFSDSIGNIGSSDFILEKNYHKINVNIDDLYNNHFDKHFDSDNKCILTTNKTNVIIKMIVENESLKDKKNDNYLIIKSSGTIKRQKILTENGIRVAHIDFYNISNDREDFNIFYNDEVKIINSFALIKQDKIILNVSDLFTSGVNYHYLPYKSDEFASVNVNYTNRNTFKCTIMPNNIINIVRLNNKNFIEEIELEITAFDKKHLYQTATKKVKGIFYNDSIITSYHIDDTFSNGKISSNLFNLYIKSYNQSNIEYIKFYDIHELDISKRNKFAQYDNEKQVYVIKNIVSPIEPETLDVSIKIKNTNLIINKTFFEDSPISILLEKNNFKTTYTKEFGNVNLKFINQNKNDYMFNKIEIFQDGKLFDSKTNISFSKNNYFYIFEYDINKFDQPITFTIKATNSFNKVIYVENVLVDCTKPISFGAKLEGFEYFNLKTPDELNNIKVITNIKDGNFYLQVENIFREVSNFNLSNINNSIYLEPGYYLFKLFYKKNTYKKHIGTYNVEIVKDKKDLIDYSTDYANYNKINEIFIKKHFNTPFEHLSPRILHYNNGNLVSDNYQPEYLNEEIKFTINKKIGFNELIYIDNVQTIPLKSFEYVNKTDKREFEIFSVHTNGQSLFYNNENTIILQSSDDLYFKTIGLDKAIISTPMIRSLIDKYLSDKLTTVIFKEFMPCTIDFYKEGYLVHTLNVQFNTVEKITLPLFNSDSEEIYSDRIKLKLIPGPVVWSQDKYNLSIKNKIKHFLLPYAIGVARNQCNKDFLKLNSEEQENIIKEISLKASTQDVELIKKYIKEYMEEK